MPEISPVGPGVTKVLVVEDNAVDARLIQGLLARAKTEPYSVTQVATLQEAFRELEKRVHDVVLLDLGLPDSFGLDTLRRLCAHPCNLPMVVLTGTEDATVGNAAIQEGAQDFLLKGELQAGMLARSIRYASERHHVAAVLRETNELLSRTVASALDAIITKSVDGTITSWNPAAETLLGYSRGEIIGKSILTLFPPARVLEEADILKRICNGERVESFETTRLRKDGKEIHLCVTISPIRDTEGNVIGASKIARDISKQKQAEEILRTSERHLRQFIEEAPVCVAMFDRDMRYLAVSRRWIEDYGRGRHDLVGLTHYELHPDIPQRWKELHRRGLAGEILRGDEDRWVHQDGTEGWLRWAIHPWHESSGDIGGIIISAEDITQRKVVEDTMRRQASLIDQAYDAVFVWEIGGTITFWNCGAEKMYGFSKAEAIGHSSQQLLAAAPASLERCLGCLTQVGGWEGELEHTRADGKRIVVESRMVQIAEGGKSYVLETNRDVTDKKLLEDQLRQSQKMEAIGRLAGGVAHDFNNLLGVILGSAELAAESTDLLKIRRGLEQIRKAGERAANLTKQLLAFSRKQVLEPRVLDLNAKVADITEMLRRLVGEDVDVRTSLSSALWSVRVDPTQIEQILLNLAINARDAMPRGGNLTIETRNVEVDDTYSRSHASASPGQYVMIAVSDSGCGMDAETQARIFEPFFTTKKDGTGLGLATVYGAVKQSGGYIWVYSEPRRGATFKIYFPRVAAAENTVNGEESPSSKATGAGTILLVEDSEALRMVTREFLLLAGYTVKEASNGEEALNIARTHDGPIHLLLTDMVMPGMGGRELAKALAQFRPEMRVLFMSGYAANAIVSHGDLDEGASFLPKPFSRASLTNKVREVLNSLPNSAGKQLQP